MKIKEILKVIKPLAIHGNPGRTTVGYYEPQEEVPHGHAERDKVCY
ncbi:MAG: hypothetical protein QXQ65_03400 [Conexivisphaerales archaeon]